MPGLLADLISGPMAVRTSEGIAHVLRKAILAGILSPGQQLRERRLAEELRVSRTPIREALFTLRGEGLVDLTPNQCARVSHVTQSDIKQIYALRRLLESHSARLAAENGDRVKIDRVADALAAQQRLGKAGTAQDQAQADLAFHEAVAAAAGSQLLLTVERQVLAVTITHRSRYKYSNPQLKRGWRQHGEVLKAIEAGDGGSAETLMAEHIAESSEIAFKHFGADRPRGCRESVGSPKRPEVRG
ncbi:MAG TPA: GntR family transcriptional regulator [Alphaproteobacteria bacterium]|jgi:DNA-binding GntR family transcriptional regulator|nr:GntR family transcriptional regulator [Alphaproteobacteria bacterium]HJN59765.1 GntR family transcriptional regulator [Alphaproteobacteria bacterium]